MLIVIDEMVIFTIISLFLFVQNQFKSRLLQDFTVEMRRMRDQMEKQNKIFVDAFSQMSIQLGLKSRSSDQFLVANKSSVDLRSLSHF